MDFVLLVLILATVTLLANVLLWIPILGKLFYLLGKVLRVVGFIVGILCGWAALVVLDWVPAPF